MSSIDETVLFKFNEKDEKLFKKTLTIAYDALNEKGIVRLIKLDICTGDPAYIPRHVMHVT